MQEQFNFFNSVSHSFLKSEVNSNTQIKINLVEGRFEFCIKVFHTKDVLCQVSLNLSQFFWRKIRQ